MASIKSYNKRLESLRSERSSFISLYRELSDNILAHRGRFLSSDRNKGHKRNTRQYNNTARYASRVQEAGMMAGISSPARPWFALRAQDPDMNEFRPVKDYLFKAQSTLYRVFSHSNLYNSLHMIYGELGTFGIAPMGIYHDFENVIRCKPYTVGSYSLGANGLGVIDTIYLEFEKTVAQLVGEYGLENCSEEVQNNWKKGNTEHWVKVVHLVEPNDDRDSQSPLARDKAYRSVYYEYETGMKGGEDKFLRQSGFDTFPVPSPRWDVTGEDVYATDCPGMMCLGDVKALQLAERRSFQAVDILTKPPLQGPATLVAKMKNATFGDHIAVDGGAANSQLSSVYGNYRPDINVIEMKIDKAEDRINRAYYVDLFLMLANSDRRQITAREIAEKHEEKLLQLGPVLERLHTELLDPTIDRTFNILQQAGVLPVPPPELEDQDLKVEYVSILAQAQRMVAVSGIERVAGFVGELTNIWPEARHKIDANQAIDEYAESMGVNPRIIRSDDQADELVQAEREAAAQAAAMEQGQQLANTASTVADIPIGDENALQTMLSNAGLV